MSERREPFWMGPRRLDSICDQLSASQLRLLVKVCLRRDEGADGLLFSTERELGSILGCADRTASRALDKLIELKLVETDQGQGKRGTRKRIWPAPLAVAQVIPTDDFGHFNDPQCPK